MKLFKFFLTLLSILMLISSFLFFSCIQNTNGTTTDDSTSTTSSDTNTDILKALGVDTDLGARKKTDGTSMTDSDNPFGNSVTKLLITDEVFCVSMDNQVNLWDVNPTNTFSALSVTQSASTLTAANPAKDLYKRPVAADMDGNGKQEIVVAMFSLTAKKIYFYQITDGTSYTMSLKQTIDWQSPKTYSDPREWYEEIDLAAGDIDGDEKDEILLTAENNLYILDDTFIQLTLNTACSQYTALNSTTGQCLRVECGDLNHDRKAEIVICNGDMYNNGNIAEISVLKYTSSGLTKLIDAQKAITTSTSKSICSADAKIGDVDGDGYPEIVLAGISYSTTQIYTMIMKPVISSGIITSAGILAQYHAGNLTSTVQSGPTWDSLRDYDVAIPILGVGDFDGDGTDDIVSNNDVLKYDPTSSTSLTYGCGTASEVLLPDMWSAKRRDTAFYNQMYVGDVNSDGKKEIIILDWERNFLRFYTYTANGKIERGSNISFTQMSNPFLCLADIDNDGAVVQYMGHALTFSEPVIVAVLASPPYWSDKKQYTGNSCTVFTKSTGATVGGSINFGLKSGTTAGVKAQLPVVGNGEVSTTYSITHSVDFTFDIESTYQCDLSFTSMAGHNSVVFTAIPVDIYSYKVISAGPDSSYTAGDILNAIANRANTLYMQEIDFYNSHNGAYPDVDTTVFNHTIGNPPTYPTKATAMTRANNSPLNTFMWASDTKGIVPEGENYSTMTYADCTTIGGSFTYDLEVTRESEISFIVVGGSKQSIHAGFTIYGSGSTGTAISGTVGGLAASDYTTANLYNWGIYSYNQALSGDQKFLVLNYWVNK